MRRSTPAFYTLFKCCKWLLLIVNHTISSKILMMLAVAVLCHLPQDIWLRANIFLEFNYDWISSIVRKKHNHLLVDSPKVSVICSKCRWRSSLVSMIIFFLKIFYSVINCEFIHHIHLFMDGLKQKPYLKQAAIYYLSGLPHFHIFTICLWTQIMSLLVVFRSNINFLKIFSYI